MQFERFVASRLAGARAKGFTKTIIRFAIAATAISLAVMLIATAMITGFKREISQKVFGFWGHIHITDTRAFSTYEAVPFERDTALEEKIRSLNNLGNAMDLQSDGGVRHLQRFAQVPGIIRTAETMEGMILKGVAEDIDWQILRSYLKEGTVLDLAPGTVSEGIVISRVTADRLKVKTGDTFVVHFVRDENQLQRRFTVKGIFQTGLEDYDRKFAIVDIRKVQQLLGWEEDQIAGYEIYVDNIDDADAIRDFIYIEYLPANLYAETIRQKFPNIFEWLELQNINEIVILALTLVVAMINMVTVLLILILERSQMIAILKTVGSPNWQIRRIFLWNAWIILTRGLLWGNLIGLAICFLQYYFKLIKLNEADYYIAYAPIYVNPFYVLGINAGTMLLTMLVLIIPSMLIMRMQPVKVLRFQ